MKRLREARDTAEVGSSGRARGADELNRNIEQCLQPVLDKLLRRTELLAPHRDVAFECEPVEADRGAAQRVWIA